MDLRNFQSLQEAYLEVYEGKVEWDNPKRPLQSGLTPREKNRAVRKRLGIENPDNPSFFEGGPSEKDYERYGKLQAAHETEKDKKVPDEKIHEFKSVAKGRLGGKYSLGRIRRMAGVHKGAQTGKNAEKGTGRYSVMSQVQGGEKVREKHKKRYGDYADLRRLQEPKESFDLYDLILFHLLDEGYAETPEAAEVMMVNMSEEWRDSIMERRYGEDEKLPGSGLTPKQKYRRKHKQFLKKSADKFQGSYDPRLIHPEDAMETGRQRAQRMAANYGIGATR